MQNSKPKHHSGVALITALLVVSLATILAVSLVSHLYFDIRRTSNILRLDQARIYNSNMVDLARQVLTRDGIETETDTLLEANTFNDMAAMLYPDKSGGIATATITDLQGCFNLNNLVENNVVNADARTVYINLLRILISAAATASANNPEPPPNPNPNVLADSLIDWIDTDLEAQISGNGAEFDTYLSLDPPYQTANAPLSSMSELLLIRGYDKYVKDDLLGDNACIIPSLATNSDINVNTASAEVLESITGLDAAQVTTLIESRDGTNPDFTEGSPFDSTPNFQTYVSTTFNLPPFEATGMQVFSEYFLVKTFIPLDEFEIRMSTVIHRDQNTNETRVVSQTRGDL